jgi:hypothetical protein
MGWVFGMHGKEDKYIEFFVVVKLKIKVLIGRRRITWENNSKMWPKKIGLVVWPEFFCLRIGSSSEILRKKKGNEFSVQKNVL